MTGPGGSDGDDETDEGKPVNGGWFGYLGDEHGTPRADGNEHLTADQRAALEQLARETAERRGRHLATVVVHVYESGEAVPSVQVPKGSDLDMQDRALVNEAVGRAAEALLNWS